MMKDTSNYRGSGADRDLVSSQSKQPGSADRLDSDAYDTHRDDLERASALHGPALVLAAFPTLTCAAQVLMRRTSELAGAAPNLGVLLIAAAIISGGFVVLADAGNRRVANLITVIAVVAGFVAAGLAFHRIPDFGYDSQTLHLPSVLRLMSGWRPLIEPTDILQSNTYPSAGWTVLAGSDALLGFESGRAIYALLSLSSGALLWAIIRGAGVPVLAATIMAIVGAANPVILYQFFTSYEDAPLGNLIVILFCGLMLAIDDRRWIVCLLSGATLILLVNIKLVGIFFALLTISVVLLFVVMRYGKGFGTFLRERVAQITAITLAFVVATGFVGWRPNITNLIAYGQFVYPPADEIGYRPKTGDQIPVDLRQAGRARKLLSLFFARTDTKGLRVVWKIPGTVARNELNLNESPRVGGFGALFGAATILGFVTVLAAVVGSAYGGFRIQGRRAIEAPTALLLIALLTTGLFPEPWWARFVPVAWEIPLACALLAWGFASKSAILRRLVAIGCTVTVAVCVLNSALIGAIAVRSSVFWTGYVHDKLLHLAHLPRPIYLSGSRAIDVWQRRLAALGRTDIVTLPQEQCRAVMNIMVDVNECTPPGANQ
jgi:hypothetical protein